MTKIHTRAKRKFLLTSNLRHQFFWHPRGKKSRPKTFKTEESAHTWAAKHGMKKESYTFKKVKKNKKFQIVEKTQ